MHRTINKLLVPPYPQHDLPLAPRYAMIRATNQRTEETYTTVHFMMLVGM